MDETTTPDTPEAEITVRRQLDLDVSPDELWRTIVDDDERAAWWGGDTALDLRPGGEGHATEPDGTVRRIRVEEIDPGHRLAYRWWSDGEAASAVELVVLPRPEGSRLTVTETRPTCAARGPVLADRMLDLELVVLCRVRV